MTPPTFFLRSPGLCACVSHRDDDDDDDGNDDDDYDDDDNGDNESVGAFYDGKSNQNFHLVWYA